MNARDGIATARIGVGRDKSSAAPHEAFSTRSLCSQATVANSNGATNGTAIGPLERTAITVTGNQSNHSIALIDHKREAVASVVSRRRITSLTGTATNGARRLVPATPTRIKGILCAWAALDQSRKSAPVMRKRPHLLMRKSGLEPVNISV